MNWLSQGYYLGLLMILGWSVAGTATAEEATADSLARDFDRVTELIVMIEGDLGIGAGIVFGRKDDQVYVATANHIVRSGKREASDLRVMLRALPGQWLDATLMEHADPELDLAVLSVQGLTGRGITFCALPLDRLGDSAAARRGDAVFPVGYPNAVRWGTPVAPDRIAQVIGDEIAFQSTFIGPGHSGGGLITERGDLIGMIVADSPPFARATGIEMILGRLRQWEYPIQLHTAADFVTTPLHVALEKGDREQVRHLLDICAFINTYSDSGMMPLHIASGRGRWDETRLLLDAGADVTARTSLPPQTADLRALTPLHLAAASGSAEVAELLLDHGAEIDAVAEDYFGREWGGTPLHRAAASGSEEVVALLLAHGADPEALSEEGTPLAAATRHNQIPAMKLLIAHGADVNGKPQALGEVPLYLAADQGHVEAVKVLLEAGANLELEGSFGTPLHRAAKHGHVEIVDLLLEAGAKVNSKSPFDVTPLHEAVKGGHLQVIKRLLEAGADAMAPDAGRITPYALAESPQMKAVFSSVGRGWLGVEGRDVSSEMAEDLGLQLADGVLIVTTTPFGPADNAGLRPDDVILGFRDHGVRSIADLVSFVRSTPVGTMVELKVFRNGEIIKPTMRVGERSN